MQLRTKRLSQVAAILLFALTLDLGLRADLKYEESNQITGGMLQGATKIMSFFGAKGLDKTASTHYIKGDRLRTDNLVNNELTDSTIVRLDSEEIINIDHKKKSYTVITFEQMRQQMQKAMEAMQQQQQQQQNKTSDAKNEAKAPDVKVEPKVSIKDTGETKVINGFNTRHMILSVQLEGEDQKTQDKGAMGADSDLWITKDISGFAEQREFYKKYAAKMGSVLMPKGMAASAGTDPRVGPAVAELSKQAEKMEGVPVLTVTSVNISATPSEGTQSSQRNSSSSQTSSGSSGQESSSSGKEAVAESLGKVLGGFGGFGRKKKKEEPKPATSESSSTDSSSTGPASVNLMKMTSELKSLSNGPLDSSLFEIPQGYKLIQK
jgi:hypothetical protein